MLRTDEDENVRRILDWKCEKNRELESCKHG